MYPCIRVSFRPSVGNAVLVIQAVILHTSDQERRGRDWRGRVLEREGSERERQKREGYLFEP